MEFNLQSQPDAKEANHNEEARKRAQASSIAAAEAGLAFIASQAERKRVPRVTRRGAVRRLGGAVYVSREDAEAFGVRGSAPILKTPTCLCDLWV